MRILVVEDDEWGADVYRESIEHAGHAACVAYTVDTAIEMLATGGIEAVITDLGLPYQGRYKDGHGLTVANAARQAGLPVVIASGNDTLVRVAKAAGWHAYFKPVRIPDLLADLEAQRKEKVAA